MSGRINKTGNRQHALVDRGADLYETPAVAVRALLDAEWIPAKVWEPACGPGAIVEALRATGRKVVPSDLHDYGCNGQAVLDFLAAKRALADCIVTNPPYKDAAAFVEKALELCPRVIMLLRLAFLESERRRPILENGLLARVHVFRNRLPMMHRDGWEGPRASSATPFAWYVWTRDHRGPTQLNRISWNLETEQQRCPKQR